MAIILGVSIARSSIAAKKNDAEPPHTPTLVFYLTGSTDQRDEDVLRASVQKLKSVRKVNVNAAREWIQVQFDSHVVSYHQVAQAIADAGAALGRKYDPWL